MPLALPLAGPSLSPPAGRGLGEGPTMTGSFLCSQFMGGLTTAMFLFLIASGLSLVFGILRVLNFAHGSFYMIGAYLTWQGVQWLAPAPARFWLAALSAAIAVALLGGL